MTDNFQNTVSDTLIAKINASVENVDNRVQYKTIVVSSAEILALNATPKELVAAPGTGLVLEFMSAVMVLNFNQNAYANNGILSVRQTDDSGTALSENLLLANLLALTADTIRSVQALSAGPALLEDVPLVLSVATGETDTGDSPITIKVAYRVHSTGL